MKKFLIGIALSSILTIGLYANEIEDKIELCDRQGDFKCALEYTKKYLDMEIKEGADAISIAKKYDLIGRYQMLLGKYKEASVSFSKALELYKKGNADKYFINDIYPRLATAYYSIGDNKKALTFYNKAIKVLDPQQYKKELPTIYGNRGFVHMTLNNYKKAEEDLDKSIELYKNTGRGESLDVAKVYMSKGQILKDQRTDLKEALNLFNKALKIFEKKEPNSIYLSDIYVDAGNIYLELSQYDKALNYFKKALRILRESGDSEDILDIAYIENVLSLIYYKKNDLKNTLKHVKNTLEIYTEVLGKDHPETIKVKKAAESLEKAINSK